MNTNEIHIWAPRWKDRTVLIANWKISKTPTANNRIIIDAKRADGTKFYPEPFYMHSSDLFSYPTETVKGHTMRVVKLDDLLNGENDE